MHGDVGILWTPGRCRIDGHHSSRNRAGRHVSGYGGRLATKFGIVRDKADPAARSINGRPEYVRGCCGASLKRLGVERIDLYYQHRVDPNVPIEETVGAMAELVRAGKVRPRVNGIPRI